MVPEYLTLDRWNYLSRIGDLPRSVSHPKGRTILGPRLAPVVEPCRRYISVTKPLLDLGNIGLVIERVGGGRRAQRVNTESFHLSSKARIAPIFSDDVVIDRVRIEGAVEFTRAIICDRTKPGGGGRYRRHGRRVRRIPRLVAGPSHAQG